MIVLTPHDLTLATPSAGRPRSVSHSSIPAVEAGRTAGVGSIALYCGPRHHCRDLSTRSGDRWAPAVSGPWWGSCVSGWADHGAGSGSEAE